MGIDPIVGEVAESVSESGAHRHLVQLVGPRDPFDGQVKMEAAADYIADAFRRSGLPVTEDPFRIEGRWYRNLVASIPGSAPDNGQVMVIAHYDTVPDCPGADDNASGVAGLLEAAGALARHRFHKNVVFVAFALEEYGYPGSLHYVQQARSRKAAIAGVFDLEMIGYTSPHQATLPGIPAPAVGDFIGVVGNQQSERLVSLFTEAAALFVPSLHVEGLIVEGNGEDLPAARLSDHAPFWDAGYPAVMITDTAFLRNPHYHRSTDTLDTLDLPFLRRVAAATAVAAALLASPV